MILECSWEGCDLKSKRASVIQYFESVIFLQLFCIYITLILSKNIFKKSAFLSISFLRLAFKQSLSFAFLKYRTDGVISSCLYGASCVFLYMLMAHIKETLRCIFLQGSVVIECWVASQQYLSFGRMDIVFESHLKCVKPFRRHHCPFPFLQKWVAFFSTIRWFASECLWFNQWSFWG